MQALIDAGDQILVAIQEKSTLATSIDEHDATNTVSSETLEEMALLITTATKKRSTLKVLTTDIEHCNNSTTARKVIASARATGDELSAFEA